MAGDWSKLHNEGLLGCTARHILLGVIIEMDRASGTHG